MAARRRKKGTRQVDHVPTFEAHGFINQGESGNNVYGDCPFCGDTKFYIHPKRGVWDCKKGCGSGNVSQFLGHMAETYEEDAKAELKHVRRLAKLKGLPSIAFDGWPIGWVGPKEFSMSVRNVYGTVVDIRTFDPKALRPKWMSTKGCKSGLLGAEQLNEPELRDAPVYVCEGELDAVALQYLLRATDHDAVCVAVPGASVFKDEWTEWFQGRDIVLVYDHDMPGAEGELRAWQKLKGVGSRVRCVHWPDRLPEGSDARDWVVRAVKRKAKAKGAADFLELLHDAPRNQPAEETGSTEPIGVLPPPPQIGFSEMMETFKKHLVLQDYEPVEVAAAFIASNALPGDPLWGFLVAPPGYAKTEILRTLEHSPRCVFRESLTSKSLVSGVNPNLVGGKDPSLLPKLDGKCLVVKDFTPILELNEAEQGEIFGTLRTAYDGEVSKQFGTGEKKFKSRFTVLAAVTPAIYKTMNANTSLGERFLMYRMGKFLDHGDEHVDEVQEKILETSGNEDGMRTELNQAMRGVIEYLPLKMKPAEQPKVPREIRSKLKLLGNFLARMRGSILRDERDSARILAMPSSEMPSRVTRQLLKLVRAMALVRGHVEAKDMDYQTAYKVALDSMEPLRVEMMKFMLSRSLSPGAYVPFLDIVNGTGMPRPTVQRTVADLVALQLLTKSSMKRAYELHPRFRLLMLQLCPWDWQPEELKPPEPKNVTRLPPRPHTSRSGSGGVKPRVRRLKRR